jgi:hypothetical protein
MQYWGHHTGIGRHPNGLLLASSCRRPLYIAMPCVQGSLDGDVEFGA